MCTTTTTVCNYSVCVPTGLVLFDRANEKIILHIRSITLLNFSKVGNC